MDHMNVQYRKKFFKFFVLLSEFTLLYHRHYVDENLPFPEGFARPFYIEHKFEHDETGTLVKICVDVDDFPMTEQQKVLQDSTHGIKGTYQAATLII